MKRRITFLALSALLTCSASFGQSGNFGIGTSTPHNSALLDLTSTSKGLLLPRLTTTQRDLISSPAAGLAVFNITTNTVEYNVGTSAAPIWNAVNMSTKALTGISTPAGTAIGQLVMNSNASSGLPIGPVYWDGSKWNTLLNTTPKSLEFTNGAPTGVGQAGVLYTDTATNSPTQGNQYIYDGTGFVAFDSPNPTAFYSQGGTKDAAGDKLGVIYRPGAVGIGTTMNPDPSAILDVNSTKQGFLPPRMLRAQMNAITAPADGLIVYCIDCKPRGPFYYDSAATLNPPSPNGWQPLGSQSLGAATFASGTINCGGALTGTYSQGVAMTSSNTKTLTITANTAGSYTAGTDTVNGVYFRVSSTLFSTGAGTQVTMVASGIPAAGGSFTYRASIAGQSCTFSVTVVAPATYSCGTTTASDIAPYTDVLKNGQAYTGTVTVPYTVGNGTSYAVTTIAKDGLTLTRVAGTYASGGGNIVYNLTGTYTGETAPNAVIFTLPEGCTAQFNGQKYSAVVNAGADVVFENLKFRISTSGGRTMQMATTTGTVPAHWGTYFAYGSNAQARGGYVGNITTAYQDIWPGTSFPYAGDNQVAYIRNTDNNKYYRVEMVIGSGYNNNFIRIERADITTLSSVATGVVNAGVDVTLNNIKVRIPTGGARSIQVSTTSGSLVYTRGSFAMYSADGQVIGTDNTVGYLTANTTPSYVTPGYSFGSIGNLHEVHLYDTTNKVWYKIEAVIGGSYNNNLIRIEQMNTNLDYRSAQVVDRGVPVTFGPLKAQTSVSGAAAVQLATVTGSLATEGASWGLYGSNNYVVSYGNTTTLNTGFQPYGNPGWSFGSVGDWEKVFFRDKNTGKYYCINWFVSASYRKNLVSIERY